MRAIDNPNIEYISSRTTWRRDKLFRHSAEYKEEEPYLNDFYDGDSFLDIMFQNCFPWDPEDAPVG